jgi:hypothetical protein
MKERGLALKSLGQSSVAVVIRGRLNPIEYFKLLNQYKFVASPEGNGPDCIRTWEAILLGIIPIIRNVSNNQILSQNQLPVMVIDNWKDLEQITESQLLEMAEEYESTGKSDMIMFDYWKDIIRKHE